MPPDRQVVARRITIGLIRKTADRLDAMTARTGMTSTDVVNRAIVLAAFVDEQMATGKELLVRDPADGSTERLRLL